MLFYDDISEILDDIILSQMDVSACRSLLDSLFPYGYHSVNSGCFDVRKEIIVNGNGDYHITAYDLPYIDTCEKLVKFESNYEGAYPIMFAMLDGMDGKSDYIACSLIKIFSCVYGDPALMIFISGERVAFGTVRSERQVEDNFCISDWFLPADFDTRISFVEDAYSLSDVIGWIKDNSQLEKTKTYSKKKNRKTSSKMQSWNYDCHDFSLDYIHALSEFQYYTGVSTERQRHEYYLAFDDETGETTYKFTLPEIKEYFQWLNHMNDIGLLDPESFTQKEDTYKAKISSGRVVGLSDAAWDYSDAEKTLLSEGKAGSTYARLAVTVSDEYKDQSLKDYGFGGGWGIAISESCENKERAFEFLDWMASDEAQVLLNWGIEGEHYTIEDGKRVVLPEVQEQKNTDPDFGKKTGIGSYVYPFPQRGVGAVDSTGNSYTTTTIESVVANYNDAQKETLAGYGIDNFTEMFPSSEELGISKHGQVWQYTIPSDSDISIIQQKCDDYIQQAITQAILGKPADFDKAWDEIQKTLVSYGVDTLNEEMTALTKERLELWNE